MLYGTNGPIRPKRVMVFVFGRKGKDLVTEIAVRVRSARHRFALYYPPLHGSFISRLNPPAKDRGLGPAPECFDVSRQPMGVDHHVVINPNDKVPFGNIYRAI